jgi:phosphatidylglycerol:prolipoprotein diacylglycerol transferase
VHPVVELGSWSVAAYPLLLGAGLSTCLLVATAFAPRFELPRGFVALSGLACAISGYGGAKLYSALVEVGFSAWWSGTARAGLSVHGGLIAGGLALLCMGYLFGIGRLRLVAAIDLMATVLPLGLAFGRVGCLLSGCCYGRPTRFVWALIYTNFAATARPIGVPLHATQIYLALGNLLLFVVVIGWRMPAARVRGQLALEVLSMVSLLRFAVEFLRADNRGPALWLDLPWAQWVAAAVVVAASLGWVGLRRRRRASDAMSLSLP